MFEQCVYSLWIPLSPHAAAWLYNHGVCTLERSGVSSAVRPGHTRDTCIVPCNLGCDKCCSQTLLLLACNLHLHPCIWVPKDICCRLAREQWRVTKKRSHQWYLKISRYSAPLQRAPAPHQLECPELLQALLRHFPAAGFLQHGETRDSLSGTH